MPLFISISGFLFYPSVTKLSFCDYTKKNILRLYLPSIVWGSISVIIIVVSKIISHRPIEFCYVSSILFTGMWYLTVLCVLNIMGSLLYHIYRNNILWLWLIAMCIIYFLPSFGVINYIKYLTPFFVGGYCCRRYNIVKIPLWLFAICLISFIYLLYTTYTFEYSVYAMKSNVLSIEYLYMTAIRFISGFTGSIMALYFCNRLLAFNQITRLLAKIGTVTLPIYVVHQKFLIPTKLFDYSTTNIFIWILVAMFILFASLMVNKWISNNFLRLLFFGEPIMRK